jgi:L-iditol 2-dehydrogenase
MAFCATPPYHGTLTRYFAHPADFCFKLPDHVSFEEGAMLEPLSVAVHACHRANIALGDNVLICGAGPIGLMNLLTAKASGAAKICITDIDEHRLSVAKSLGADFTYRCTKKDVRAQADDIVNLLDGRGPDKTVECSGAETSVQLAIYGTKSGGTIVLVGMGPAEIRLPIVNAAIREVDIRGVFRYANSYPVALAMVASGRVNVKPLVTHRFKLEESLKAFETAKTGAGNAIKVVIKCASFDEK